MSALLVPSERDIKRTLASLQGHAELGRDLHDPVVKELVRRGISPIAGAASGLNPAVFMNNVPAPGSYAINQQSFNLLTRRNDVPGPTNEWPGWGGRIEQRVANVGVLTNIRLFVELEATVSGTGTVTSKWNWPHGLIKNVSLNANGGTSLIKCNGLDLRARRQRLFRTPYEGLETAPGMDTTATISAAAPYRPVGQVFPGTIANGKYTITLVVDLPIVHDAVSLTGALFAQSDQNYLNWVIETAQEGDTLTVGTGSTVVLKGNIRMESTFYQIPSQDANNGRIVILPEAVKWLHEFVSVDKPFSNQGAVQVPLPRSNGQLLAVYQYIENGTAGQISPLSLEKIEWLFGTNIVPRNMYPQMLLEENQRLYNGFITPGYYVLDFEAENWQREGVYPRGLSELEIRPVIPSSITVQSIAKVHTVQETLTTGS